MLIMGDHCGTHVDSPSHFIEGGKTIEQIDVNLLIGRGVCLDFSAILSKNSEITQKMIQDWENLHGDIQKNDIVLLRTGYDLLWKTRPNNTDFLNDWSGLSETGADYLLGKGVRVIGIDTLALDRFGNKTNPCHWKVLGGDNLILENLANLHLLPDFFTFIALPLRIKRASASPIRAIALVEKQ